MVAGLIVAGSIILGLAAVAQDRASPFFNHPIIDEYDYVSWASEIAGGEVIGHEVFYLDPLYAYALALVFKLFGPGLLLVRVFQVLLGAAVVGMAYRIGRRLVSPGVGLLAALFMATYGPLYFFELQVLKETMIVFFSAFMIILSIRVRERPELLRRAVLLGVIMSLLNLLRGNFQALFPFLLALLYGQDRAAPRPRRALRVLAAAGGVLLVTAPVLVRNYAVSGQWVATRLGGANFYLGNSEYADGRYPHIPFIRSHPRFEDEDFEAEAARRLGRTLTPAEASHYWLGEGLRWIENNPGAAAGLGLHKARLLVHQFEVSDNYSFYVVRDLFAPALRLAPGGFGPLWGLALVGIVVLVRKDERAWFAALFAVLYPLSIIPFYVLDRYRMAIVPAVCVLAAAGLGWAWRQVKQRRGRALAAAGGVWALSLLISFIPIAEQREPRALDYYSVGNVLCSIEEIDQCIAWYEMALSDLPPGGNDTRAEIDSRLKLARESKDLRAAADQAADPARLAALGLELEARGQFKTAVALYQRAAQFPSPDPELIIHLGELLCTHDAVLDPRQGQVYLESIGGPRAQTPQVLTDLGYCAYWAGDARAARAYWNEALRQDPDFAPARQALVRPTKRTIVR
jgi:4-amino-4-deoxy-L-arabinose transferase-like glycosyltransferase